MAEILTEELLQSVEKEEKENNINFEESEEQIVVHNLEGPYLMKKCNWPKLVLHDTDLDGQGSTERVEESCQNPSGEKMGENDVWDFTIEYEENTKDKEADREEENDQGWSVSATKKKAKSKRAKRATVAPTRRSERIPQDGVPIFENTSTRVKPKNLDTGTVHSNNPFTIINDTPNASICNIIDELDIVVDDKESFINAIKAEEIVRLRLLKLYIGIFWKKRVKRMLVLMEEI